MVFSGGFLGVFVGFFVGLLLVFKQTSNTDVDISI